MRSPVIRRATLITVVLAGVFIPAMAFSSPAAAQVAPPAPGTPGPYQRTISVTGTGAVTLAPDVAYFSAGVTQTNTNVIDAQNATNTATNAIIDALRAGGVDVDKDVKTSGYSVQPQYNYPMNGSPMLTGYRVTNNVNVTVRDINKTGQLLNAVTQAGANQVGGVSFGLADPEVAGRAAREMAVQNARDKAETLAKAGGVSVGVVFSIEDQSSTPPAPRALNQAPSAVNAQSGAAVAPPIQTGETTVTVMVQVVYTIA